MKKIDHSDLRKAIDRAEKLAAALSVNACGDRKALAESIICLSMANEKIRGVLSFAEVPDEF